MPATFAQRLREGDLLVGTFVSLGSPLVANVLATAGFDFVLLDLEHGAGDEGVLQAQMFAAEAGGAAAVVRTETFERIRIGRVLDLGAAGVMLPRVDSARQAAQATVHLRYPPEGDRGVAGANRARRFGLRTEPFADASGEVACIVQIESDQAVAEVDAIAAVPGVDALFVGPSDLSHSLGVPGDLDAGPFRDAVQRVLAAARAQGVAAGILAPTPERGRQFIADGFTLVGLGGDATLLAAAARDVLSAARS
jgi:2-dehydro-3-deoxyglucarate aldolase/4-hydroxy-2-oxoheptanedioate aldolase